MRLFFFILTGFLALGSSHVSMNKDSFIPSTRHIDTTKGVIIQNSLPKGNGRLDSTGKNGYNDPAGKNFAYAIFWTRVINETATPLELTINFPADSFAIPHYLNSYLKLFLPPDTMTPDKESLYNYGLKGLKSFLDTSFNKPSMLQRTINPKEECRFYIAYIVALSDVRYNGAVRTELILKEQGLFYKINRLDSLIPCGHIVFKK
jgi:hypothetical protein